jgi:hypothetical protein
LRAQRRNPGRINGLVGVTGWDPYDALSANWIRALARAPLLRRIAIQSVKRSPLNVRPLLAVKRMRHTKGLALCASAFARVAGAQSDPGGAHSGSAGAQYGTELDPRAADVAVGLANELLDRAITCEHGVGWGYDFDVQTRWGCYRRGTPNAVVTSFVAHALLDVAQLQGGDGRFAAAAQQAVDYACAQLAVQRAGETWFAYFAGSQVPIHNANLLVAALIARCADEHGDASEHDDAEAPTQPSGSSARDLELAAGALAYTLRHQQPDGSWRYGEAPGLQWVDGFHTAYLLHDLQRWLRHTGEADSLGHGVDDVPGRDIADALHRGLDLYLSRLIDPNGAPRASLAARYPIDIHACATAISALSQLDANDPRATPTALRVLDWTLAHMARSDGQFAFQRHCHHRDSTPYFRWGNAHMLLALADVIAARDPTPSSFPSLSLPRPRMNADRVRILGCDIDRLDMAGTLERCCAVIDSRLYTQHVAINAVKLVTLRQQPELREVIERCQLVNADGQSIVWASRLLGDPLPERVAGVDLMHELLATAEHRGYRVFILGAREPVLQAAVHRLHQRHPQLALAGAHHGYFCRGGKPRHRRRNTRGAPRHPVRRHELAPQRAVARALRRVTCRPARDGRRRRHRHRGRHHPACAQGLAAARRRVALPPAAGATADVRPLSRHQPAVQRPTSARTRRARARSRFALQAYRSRPAGVTREVSRGLWWFETDCRLGNRLASAFRLHRRYRCANRYLLAGRRPPRCEAA